MKMITIVCPCCKKSISIGIPEDKDPVNGQSFDVVIYDDEDRS